MCTTDCSCLVLWPAFVDKLFVKHGQYYVLRINQPMIEHSLIGVAL